MLLSLSMMASEARVVRVTLANPRFCENRDRGFHCSSRYETCHCRLERGGSRRGTEGKRYGGVRPVAGRGTGSDAPMRWPHRLAAGSRAMQEKLIAAINTNNIVPVVDRSFPFESLAQAFEYQASGAKHHAVRQ